MTNEKQPSLDIIAGLSQFGLTENDISVYKFLLERGKSFGGSSIASGISLHRQYVYNSLEKLLGLEFIEVTKSGKRSKYKALPPKYVDRLAKSRLAQAEKAVRELEAISAVGSDQDFEVFRSTQQVFDFEENLVYGLKQDETQYIIGGGSKAFIEFFGDRYEEITEEARRRGLKTLYVGAPGEESWLDYAQTINSDFQYKILESMPETIVQTVVRLDTVTFYSFGNPPLVYVVKSKAVSADYKKFFDMLWGLASQ